MLTTLEGTLDPEGRIHFRENVQLTRSQRVLVTLLDEEAIGETTIDGPERLKTLLGSSEFFRRPVGSADELEALVEQHRNAWDN